jgi:phosphatidylserine/phosphatidylglycerophosphate/cardiolipin synthase-like enzyme
LDTNTPDDPQRTRRKGELVRKQLQDAGIIVLHANLFQVEFARHKRILPAMNFHLHHHKVSAQDFACQQNRWQALHNVEDHRKNLVIDGGRAGLVTSHNLFDPAYDWHENLFWLAGDVAIALWQAAMDALRAASELPYHFVADERAQITRVLSLRSDSKIDDYQDPVCPRKLPISSYPIAWEDAPYAHAVLTSDPHCALLATQQIRSRICALLADAQAGEEVLIATAYFSDQAMLQEIEDALLRGVKVRVLWDSLDALPLPPIAAWLTRNLVNHTVLVNARKLHVRFPERFQVRIHHSRQGQMMHLKTIAKCGPRPRLIGGQANFTPNSFSGAYLETNIETQAQSVVSAFAAHFESLWHLPESLPLLVQISLWERARLWFLTQLLWLFSCLGLRP